MNINIELSIKKPIEIGSQLIAYFLPEKFIEKDLDSGLKKSALNVSEFLKDAKFTGAKGTSVNLATSFDDKKIVHFCFAGLGALQEDKKLSLETLRRAIGLVIKTARAKKVDSIAFCIPSHKDFGFDVQYFMQQITEITHIASYHFDKFITSIDKKEKNKIVTLTFCIVAADKKEAQVGLDIGNTIALAVNQTREWIDMPPSLLTPTDLAEKAQKIAKAKKLKITVFSEQEIKKMGMGGLAGVASGSGQDAKFVILEYKSKKAKAPTLGFVGKGITFDSGGLSIKPANSMEEMKEDMAGAASVINALSAIADLQPDVNVLGFVALTENMPGCDALKPGDIVTFYNGKTAEVRNTDAEGRLILADALSYAVKNYKLDCVIDVATLTGACIYAVGPFFAALLSDHEKLTKQVQESAHRSGDYVWPLPFTEDFKEAVKSHIADIQNIGNPSIAAGTITAAWFLRHFTDDVPWVHLDIASSAYNVPNISYFGKGATGKSVRLLVDIAMNWK